jgi:uncharacterized protein (DUF885 family)
VKASVAALVLVPLVAAASAGCRAHPRPEQWDAHVQRFIDDYFHANPTFAVYEGKHELDGQLPDWSAAGVQAEIARLHRERDLATAFDTSKLDEGRRFQRDYLLAVVDKDLFWLEDARFPWTNPSFYADALDPNVYIARPYAPLPVRMKAFTDWAGRVPAAVAQIRATLQLPLPLPRAEIGRLRFAGLAAYLDKDVPQVFASVTDPALRARFETARQQAAAAFHDAGVWFESLKAKAGGSFALGAERYQRMLWMTERVKLSIDQVEAMGRADLERNRKALDQACAQFAPGKSGRECADKMNADKASQDSVQAARAQLTGLKDFIVAKDLMTIPGPEQAEVRESPPYMRWNFAYIDPPGPYEHGLPAVYYVAPPDPSLSEKERAEYVPGSAELLFTSVHEVWPGHFLQFLHSNRSNDLFGRVFVGYAFAEGWAHYSEEMMWEAGLHDGDAETHVGQLSEALLRDARFLASIGMHARGMTQEQAEQLFRDQGLQTTPTARQQAARGTFDPAYLNYTLGKLMIRQMRDDWTKSRGGRSAWKPFHDAFLSHGGPPIGLMRELLLGTAAQ